MLNHLALKARRDHLHEHVQFLLVIQVVLGCDHELPDFILKQVRQLHIAHRGVREIQLLLKLLLFAVHVLDYNCDVGNDIREDQSAREVEEADQHDIESVDGIDFIADQHHNGVVVRD